MTYQEQTWNFLKSKGLPDISIASVMGNISQESNFDPNIIESGNGIGFGLCQWSFGRRTQLEAYGTDFEHQLNFLWSELTGEGVSETGANYQWINKSGYLTHEAFMTGAGTIEDLTSAFCFCWERPSEQYANLEYRQAQAEYFFITFSGLDPQLQFCKLLYPYWFGSNVKISFVENNFKVLTTHGNVVFIEDIYSSRKYYVNKSSIKLV